MKTPADILIAVKQEGGRLEPAGKKLRMLLPSNCPPELKEAIREHKSELLCFLEARAANLPEDCAPWLHIARQVLAGEFDGADRSMIESLTIGLRGIRHPVCQQALGRLNRRQCGQGTHQL
jgi:hypothetical protein